MGAHIHQENLPWGRMVIHAKQHRESKRTQSVGPIETKKPQKKAPRPARQRKSGEASHTLGLLA